MDILFSFLICLIATTAGGISGVGGGVIIKPLMDVLHGFDVQTIGVLSSLTVFSMSVVSIGKQMLARTKIPFGTAIPLALGSVAGGLLGGLVSFNTAGIDFVLTAMFVVIFINQWEATSNHLPVLIGLGAALLCWIVLGPEKFLIPAMIVILVLVTLLRGPIEKRGDL